MTKVIEFEILTQISLIMWDFRYLRHLFNPDDPKNPSHQRTLCQPFSEPYHQNCARFNDALDILASVPPLQQEATLISNTLKLSLWRVSFVFDFTLSGADQLNIGKESQPLSIWNLISEKRISFNPT